MDEPRAAPLLNLVVLRAVRLDRTRRFYEALGLRFVEEQHGQGPRHLAATTSSGMVLELFPHEALAVVGDVRLGFAVEDVQDVVTRVTAAGGKLVSPPTGTDRGLLAVVQDPDARRVELLEPPENGPTA